MYDFANSGYTTVVLTTVFNAYFVAVIAGGDGQETGTATFVWTLTVAAGNALVLLSAPIVGAIADHRASKKRFLLFTTIGCVLTTALLGFVGEGMVVAGVVLLVLSLVAFGSRRISDCGISTGDCAGGSDGPGIRLRLGPRLLRWPADSGLLPRLHHLGPGSGP